MGCFEGKCFIRPENDPGALPGADDRSRKPSARLMGKPTRARVVTRPSGAAEAEASCDGSCAFEPGPNKLRQDINALRAEGKSAKSAANLDAVQPGIGQLQSSGQVPNDRLRQSMSALRAENRASKSAADLDAVQPGIGQMQTVGRSSPARLPRAAAPKGVSSVGFDTAGGCDRPSQRAPVMVGSSGKRPAVVPTRQPEIPNVQASPKGPEIEPAAPSTPVQAQPREPRGTIDWPENVPPPPMVDDGVEFVPEEPVFEGEITPRQPEFVPEEPPGDWIAEVPVQTNPEVDVPVDNFAPAEPPMMQVPVTGRPVWSPGCASQVNAEPWNGDLDKIIRENELCRDEAIRMREWDRANSPVQATPVLVSQSGGSKVTVNVPTARAADEAAASPSDVISADLASAEGSIELDSQAADAVNADLQTADASIQLDDGSNAVGGALEGAPVAASGRAVQLVRSSGRSVQLVRSSGRAVTLVRPGAGYHGAINADRRGYDAQVQFVQPGQGYPEALDADRGGYDAQMQFVQPGGYANPYEADAAGYDASIQYVNPGQRSVEIEPAGKPYGMLQFYFPDSAYNQTLPNQIIVGPQEDRSYLNNPMARREMLQLAEPQGQWGPENNYSDTPPPRGVVGETAPSGRAVQFVSPSGRSVQLVRGSGRAVQLVKGSGRSVGLVRPSGAADWNALAKQCRNAFVALPPSVQGAILAGQGVTTVDDLLRQDSERSRAACLNIIRTAQSMGITLPSGFVSSPRLLNAFEKRLRPDYLQVLKRNLALIPAARYSGSASDPAYDAALITAIGNYQESKGTTGSALGFLGPVTFVAIARDAGDRQAGSYTEQMITSPTPVRLNDGRGATTPADQARAASEGESQQREDTASVGGSGGGAGLNQQALFGAINGIAESVFGFLSAQERANADRDIARIRAESEALARQGGGTADQNAALQAQVAALTNQLAVIGQQRGAPVDVGAMASVNAQMEMMRRQQEASSNKSQMYMLAGVGALALIGGAFVLSQRRPSGQKG